jgi:hypothetical protein
MNGIFIGIIVAMGVGGFFYWDTTSKQLTEYQSQVLAYDLKFAVQEETINTMVTQHENSQSRDRCRKRQVSGRIS